MIGGKDICQPWAAPSVRTGDRKTTDVFRLQDETDSISPLTHRNPFSNVVADNRTADRAGETCHGTLFVRRIAALIKELFDCTGSELSDGEPASVV